MKTALALAVALMICHHAQARGGNNREPCDWNAGGVVGCSGTKFICANGKISRSKRTCYMEGGKPRWKN